MYEWLKKLILPWLRVEDSEPHPPAGHEPYERLRIERAAPGFLHLRMFEWRLYAAAWGFGVAAASAAMLSIDAQLLWLVIPLVLVAIGKAAVLYVTMRLDYEMRWYVITDRSLLIREGVWNVQEITLTFANAQNVRVTQGPLERWFGFSNVEIETAGGGSGDATGAGHRARLRGLENPQEIRSLILEILRTHRTAGLGDPDDLERSRAALIGSAVSQRSGGAMLSLPASVLQEVWSEARALRSAVQNNDTKASA